MQYTKYLFAGVLAIASVHAFVFPGSSMTNVKPSARRMTQNAVSSSGLNIDMKGKTVFIGGVADSTGYGWAIAKACAEAGAKILLGTWPPVLPMFEMNIERGEFTEDMKLSDGSSMVISKVSHFITEIFTSKVVIDLSSGCCL